MLLCICGFSFFFFFFFFFLEVIDLCQYDDSLDDAINRLANVQRTCDLILGVGDGNLNTFRGKCYFHAAIELLCSDDPFQGFQYSFSVLNVMDDQNMMPDNQTWHPRIPGVVRFCRFPYLCVCASAYLCTCTFCLCA